MRRREFIAGRPEPAGTEPASPGALRRILDVTPRCRSRRGLTSVIAVMESGLMTIITGLPLLSFARTRKDSGMMLECGGFE
jgi:hypothetical protein